jgi:hypothetical protein
MRVILDLMRHILRVAAIARAAVDRIDKRLRERVGNIQLAHTRSTLLTLIEIGGDLTS